MQQRKIDQRCGYLNIGQYYIMEKLIYYNTFQWSGMSVPDRRDRNSDLWICII